MTKKVAIIGAGTAGIVAIKCCLDEGIEPVCYEKTKDIGGLWTFREDWTEPEAFQTTTVFRSTVTNTSKEITAFSDFPMPKEFPNYVQNSDFTTYLNLYAKQFDLRKHVVFSTNVTNVCPASDYAATGSWTVELTNAEDRQWSETFDGVLVCNGHHNKPHRLDFPGLDEFTGDVTHTREYKRPNGYQDKRVLVIGMGNSACDTSAELARIASKVFQSTRSGAWLTTRLATGGLPLDSLLSRASFLVPRKLVQGRVLSVINRKFDHEMFNLTPTYGFFAKSLTINDELPFQIVNGNVVMKPGISRFHKTGVEFDDGTYEDIDRVIMATGYEAETPVDESVTRVSENRLHLYRNMFPPQLEHPTLALIGLTSQSGSVNPICEIQCRWVTRLINGLCKLPSKEDMERYIENYNATLKEKGAFSADRGSLLVDSIPYMDEIAVEIGCMPRFWTIFFSFSPKLAIKCWFGMFFPYQYRLVGPSKWDGAKEAIETAWDRITGAYHVNRKKTRKPASKWGIIMKTVLFAVVFYCCCIPILMLEWESFKPDCDRNSTKFRSSDGVEPQTLRKVPC